MSMSFIATIWQKIKNWWHGTESKYVVCIDQYPKENVFIGIGGSTKLSANVKTSSPELIIKWQKVESTGLRNLRTDFIKYSGSSSLLPTPELVINNVDKSDDGDYQLEVTTVSGIVTGPKVRLTVFGDTNNTLSKEENNFLRYYILVQTLATESARLYFTRKVPVSTLASHLNSYSKDLKSSRWKCTSDQLAVLFPVVPSNVSSSKFDFTVLYKLIRNTISHLASPTRGWGSLPLPGDITEEDDIERIRHNRNLLAHNTELKLNDLDFSRLWTDLSQIIPVKHSDDKEESWMRNLCTFPFPALLKVSWAAKLIFNNVF